jgi:tRNA A-37 threonylcarbamoyl transferase component Bud32
VSADRGIPVGYRSFRLRGAHVVVREAHLSAVQAAMQEMRLYEWASHQSGSLAMRGRAPAYATTLDDRTAVVVRHSRHGGLLAPLTRDLFLRPTRAPHELRVSLRLAAAGVRTPEIIAYAVYPTLGVFATSDVASRRMYGMSFPDAWERATSDSERDRIVAAVVHLLDTLREARALHPDLNARNILILDEHPRAAVVLDVDRVEFDGASPSTIADANASRLMQSLLGQRLALGTALSASQTTAILNTVGSKR